MISHTLKETSWDERVIYHRRVCTTLPTPKTLWSKGVCKGVNRAQSLVLNAIHYVVLDVIKIWTYIFFRYFYAKRI